MKVLRLSPDLAIVPSMVQEVTVVALPHDMPMSMNYQPPSYEHPDGYSVMVRYLMADDLRPVATFMADPKPTVTLTGLGFYATESNPAYERALGHAEARAHAVYEEIIRAVKDAE